MINKVFCLTILFFFITLSCTSQEWTIIKNLGSNNSDSGITLDIDEYGNIFYIANYSDSLTVDGQLLPYDNTGDCYFSNDIIISKIDSSGNNIWTKSINGSCMDFCSNIKLNNESIFISGGLNQFSNSGSFVSFCDSNFYLNKCVGFIAKLNSIDGTLEDIILFPTSGLFCQVEFDVSSNSVFCNISFSNNLEVDGYLYETGTLNSNIYNSIILSLDNNLTNQWSKHFKSVGEDCGVNKIKYKNNRIFLFGNYNDVLIFENDSLFTFEDEIGNFIIKMTDNGELISLNKLICDNLVSYNIEMTEGSEIIFNGKFSDSLFINTEAFTPQYSTDFFICKLDTLGEIVFFNQFKGSLNTNYESWIKNININQEGEIFFYNDLFLLTDSIHIDNISFDDIGPFHHEYVAKLDINGECNWGEVMPVTNYLMNNQIKTQNHCFYLIGEYSNDNSIEGQMINSNGSTDIIILKYNGPFDFIDSIEDIRVEIFPNPTSDFLVVKNKIEDSEIKIVIYNMNSQVVFNEVFNNQPENRINIKDLDKGLYIIKIFSDSGRAINKIIKI